MKSTYFVAWWILAGLLSACAGLSTNSGQGTSPVSTVQPEAPTGTYAYVMPRPFSPFETATNGIPVFTIRLETNGTYFAETADLRPVQDGDLVRLRPDVARGKWRWDAQKREFHLEPGEFTFYIKRLRVDERNTNRIVWGSGFLERQQKK